MGERESHALPGAQVADVWLDGLHGLIWCDRRQRLRARSALGVDDVQDRFSDSMRRRGVIASSALFVDINVPFAYSTIAFFFDLYASVHRFLIPFAAQSSRCSVPMNSPL